MSLSGLNSGLYQQFSRYAELTDRALIELEERSGSIQENRKTLGNLFVDLDETRRNSPSARLIWLVLTEELNVPTQEITEAGEDLLRVGGESEKLKGLLEALALVLAGEQDDIRLRLRKGVR